METFLTFITSIKIYYSTCKRLIKNNILYLGFVNIIIGLYTRWYLLLLWTDKLDTNNYNRWFLTWRYTDVAVRHPLLTYYCWYCLAEMDLTFHLTSRALTSIKYSSRNITNPELEIKQFSTLGKIILKNIYIAHYKLRILMKMIKTN